MVGRGTPISIPNDYRGDDSVVSREMNLKIPAMVDVSICVFQRIAAPKGHIERLRACARVSSIAGINT